MMATHSLARIAAAAAIVLITLASPAYAANTRSASEPKLIQNMLKYGDLQIIKQFPTSKPGLTGYIVKRGNYQTVIYSEDEYLMVGPLFSPEGQNLSKQYARKFIPKPDVAKTIDRLDTDHLITQGPADAPTLYIFADPNCTFCHQLYQQVEPLLDAGKLRVHWIMVGVLGPSSVGRAITILDSGDPASALSKNEANFDVQNEQGGVPIGQPNATLGQVLIKNRQAMFDVGGNGTPTVLYEVAGGHWQAREGMPPGGWLKHYARSASTP